MTDEQFAFFVFGCVVGFFCCLTFMAGRWLVDRALAGFYIWKLKIELEKDD